MARVVDALRETGLSGVRAIHQQITSTVSDGSGHIEIASEAPLGITLLRFEGPSIVTRDAFVRVPGNEATVSVIPSTFDLVAFDQMARQPAIKRWTSAPPLAIEQRILRYDSLDQAAWTTTAQVRGAVDVDELQRDLGEALPDLTGGEFTRFASVSLRTADAGAAVPVNVSGQISVYLVDGLRAGSGYDGYARWEYRDWHITGGVILLDTASDSSANRRWLRFHELGHTLGFTHVTARPSLMAPSASPITAFDREAARLAYQRPPGNRAPDCDPDEVTLNRQGPRRWSAWTGSRIAR